jgi:hypothetical protein
MQTLVVILIVIAAALYAAWTLSPSGVRIRVASALLRAVESVPLPATVRAWLRRVLTAQLTRASGCGQCPQARRPHRR